MGECYRHLVLDDRVDIEKMVGQGLSLTQIARVLGVHKSTISRELRRNLWRPSTTSGAYRPEKLRWTRRHELTDVQYRATRAQARADRRSVNCHRPRVFVDDQMVTYVIDRLRDGWTPQMIAGRIKSGLAHGLVARSVCPETIYQWIYAPAQRHRGLAQYLTRGHKRRRHRSGRRVHSSHIPFRVSIHHRPPEVDDRSQFGHWEGDTVLGVKSVGDGIHTEVERKSRRLIAVKLHRVTSEAVAAAQHAIFAGLPAHAARSVTLDNGAEHHLHHRLDQLAMPVYFADPYCSWQRGTNEHFNGRLRRYLPKGTDFTSLTQTDLDDIVESINNQPLKCLNWATPNEAFNQLNSTHPTRCTSN